MERFDIFDAIESLREKGEPFCIATVIRTADITSAKAGSKAVVRANGEMLGHLGGACVQKAVKIATEDCLATGKTRLIRIKPTKSPPFMDDPEGVAVFDSGCPSGGTVDLLIEAFPLMPVLVILGQSPIARAIALHGELMGFRVRAVQVDELTSLDLTDRDFIVIAAQGTGDVDCLAAALTTPAKHVAMVASAKKASVLSEKMTGRGFTGEDLARLRSPAGLRVGGIDPHEIAISILAEIVQSRNAERLSPEAAEGTQ